MATLPSTVVNYRESGASSWETAVGGQFQAADGVQYEICCVGPSSISTKTWNPAIPPNALFAEDGFALVTEDGLYLTTEA